MTLDYFIAWFALTFPLVFSPGPANIVFALSGATQGIKKSLPLLLGVDSAYIVCSMAVAFGVGDFLQRHPLLFTTAQWLGIAYLFYLTFRFFRAGAQAGQQHNNKTSTSDNSVTSAQYRFYDGLLLQLLNPKGWSMMILMFSVFLDGSFPIVEQAIYLDVMLAVMNIATHLTWIASGAAITHYMNNPQHARKVSYIFASSLLLVTLSLLFDAIQQV